MTEQLPSHKRFLALCRALVDRAKDGIDAAWDKGLDLWEDRSARATWSKDTKVILLALMILSSGLLAEQLWPLAPPLKSQLLLLILAVVGYVLGFCEQQTSKRWGTVIFLINLCFWGEAVWPTIKSVYGWT